MIGGYIEVGGASWRWLFWVLALFAGACLILIIFTLPETYACVVQRVLDEGYMLPLLTTAQ